MGPIVKDVIVVDDDVAVAMLLDLGVITSHP
jgi:hypothetical protein